MKLGTKKDGLWKKSSAISLLQLPPPKNEDFLPKKMGPSKEVDGF